MGDLFEPVLTLQQRLPSAFVEATATKRSRRHKRQHQGNKSLQEYAAKRDYARTPEPVAASVKKNAKQRSRQRFVIQKHQASHLHYDFRLEMEAVLRSWAVPKGIPTQLRQARLAMQVEDHPLEYAAFEGTIPPGNYGAGTVMVWDRGEYEEAAGRPAAAFNAGKLHLRMRGTKLKGEWTLVKDRREEESNKWLLIKAGKSIRPFSKQADDRSALTSRSMSQIARANDAQCQSNRS